MGADQTAIERRKEIKDMTPLQENLQMAKRTGQRAFDYAMNACEEASKLMIAMQHASDDFHKNQLNGRGVTSAERAANKAIEEKHDRLMDKKAVILEAAKMIGDALDKLYGLDMSEFF